MSQNLEELHTLVRALRTEIEWASRIGIEVSSSPHPSMLPEVPPMVESEPEEAKRVAETPIPSPFEAKKPEVTEFKRDVKPPPKRADANPRRPWEAYMDPSGQEDGAPPVESPPVVDAVSAPPRPTPGPEASPAPAQAPVEASRPSTAETARARGAVVQVSEHGASPGTSTLPIVNLELGACQSLEDVKAVLGPCVRCKLHQQGRTQIVFGVGNPHADIMFVGEGPGADEDRLGEPFVGKAGQLLTRIIEGGMKLSREDVYIANIVKCRPPQNRDPLPDEVAACEPFLLTQIRMVQPKVIVALGKYAAQTLLRTDTPISRLRGSWHHYNGIPLMPTFHPSYLLRNPEHKRPVWEDIQTVMRLATTEVVLPRGER